MRRAPVLPPKAANGCAPKPTRAPSRSAGGALRGVRADAAAENVAIEIPREASGRQQREGERERERSTLPLGKI